MRRRLALWICPELYAEISRLADENALLRIERMQGAVSRWMEQPDVKEVLHRRSVTLSQRQGQ